MSYAAHLQNLYRRNRLGEAAVNYNKKMAVGTVSHKSVKTDAHIQKLMDYVAKETGKSKQDIEDHIDGKAAEFDSVRQKSPILYDTIASNIYEQELYKLYREAKVEPPKGCDIWSPVTFSKLVRRVKAENPSIFPLRNFYNKKPLVNPRIIPVPSPYPEDAKWNKIDTAAATPKGEFIFNKTCMQNDMNFAFVEGVKPKGAKYKSNGGEFPDEWAPVEFTILHEFYHYTHGDFHMSKVMGGNPTIHNWAGDFRSNYDLVKAGFHPYAEGLFNDNINYDRQETYREMYDIIEKEFKKLNPGEQEKVEEELGGKLDDHSEHDSDEEPDNPQGGTPTEEEAEEHGKKVSKKAGEVKDGAEAKQEGEGKPQPKADKGGPTNSGANNPSAVDWKSIRPRFNWKQLIERLIKSSDTTEVTYQKVNKRNITSVTLAATTGAGVVRPGEKEVPANLVKLCIVIDSSGSMSEAIKTVFANINKLFSENQTAISKAFALVEFSSDFTVYACTTNGKTGTAKPVSGVEAIKGASGAGDRVDLSVILGRTQGGGTNFSAELVSKLKGFLKEKYNVLILTDHDITVSSNRDNFLDLYKANTQQVYLILDSQATFQSVVQSLKGASANMSHL